MPDRSLACAIATVLVSVFGLAACSGGGTSSSFSPTDNPNPEEDPPQAPTAMSGKAACVDASANDRYAAFTVAKPVDGIVIATLGPVAPQTGTGTPSPPGSIPATPPVTPLTRLNPIGTPCSTATNQDACNEKVQALLDAANRSGAFYSLTTTTNPSSPTTVRDIAVATRGDDVELLTTNTFVEAVAPIDTAQEAAAIAMINGLAIDCAGNNVNESPEAFILRNATSRCDGTGDERLYTFTKKDGHFVRTDVRRIKDAGSCR